MNVEGITPNGVQWGTASLSNPVVGVAYNVSHAEWWYYSNSLLYYSSHPRRGREGYPIRHARRSTLRLYKRGWVWYLVRLILMTKDHHNPKWFSHVWYLIRLILLQFHLELFTINQLFMSHPVTGKLFAS